MTINYKYEMIPALVVLTVLAQPVSAGTYARIGFDGGGDELGIPTITDKEIDAGSGMTLEVGFVDSKDKTVSSGRSTELSFGGKIAHRSVSDSITSEDAILFGRLSLNAAHFLHNGNWRFGAGVTYHFANTLFSDIDEETEKESDFDGAAGFTLQIDRMFYNGLYRVGVKGTSIEYKSDDAPDVDGSSIGFYAGMYF